jgi:glycerophosphoryl diester phosphodiesterase
MFTRIGLGVAGTMTGNLVVLSLVTGGLGVAMYVPNAGAGAPASATVSTSVEHGTTVPRCGRDRVVVTGHRGTGPGTRTLFGKARSEDTIGAFRAAMRAGADGFETDFWPTADHEVVSHHDPTLTRMTDGTGTIGSRTADQLDGVRNDSEARVPTFGEILRTMVPTNPGVHLQQEFKDGRNFSDALLLKLAGLDRQFVGDVGARVLVTASEVSILERFQRLAPDLPVGLIERSSGRPPLGAVPSWVDVILIELGAADASYVRAAAARGHEVSLRKVESVAQLREAVRMGATRVVTDRPELLGRAC